MSSISISNQSIHHGGDTGWARQMFSYDGDDFLDLSTGINAKPYPMPPLSDKAAHLLPQWGEVEKLLIAAANYYSAGDKASLALAPGSQALIQWLPQLRHKSKVIILGPTYMEHETCWKRCGHDVSYADDLDSAFTQSPDVIIVVNPNNPTGTTYTPEALLKAVNSLAAIDGLLIVDEAFGDVTPGLSMAPYAGLDGLMILKSFGKFFGLAGIRLGVAITSESWAQKLNDAIGPWAISGLTIEIATKAYQDQSWIDETQAQLSSDQTRMNDLLTAIGMKIVGGCPLFTLGDSFDAPNLFKHLGDRGIMVRHFPTNDRWLRFGLPGGEADWKRLEQALEQY